MVAVVSSERSRKSLLRQGGARTQRGTGGIGAADAREHGAPDDAEPAITGAEADLVADGKIERAHRRRPERHLIGCRRWAPTRHRHRLEVTAAEGDADNRHGPSVQLERCERQVAPPVDFIHAPEGRVHGVEREVAVALVAGHGQIPAPAVATRVIEEIIEAAGEHGDGAAPEHGDRDRAMVALVSTRARPRGGNASRAPTPTVNGRARVSAVDNRPGFAIHARARLWRLEIRPTAMAAMRMKRVATAMTVRSTNTPGWVSTSATGPRGNNGEAATVTRAATTAATAPTDRGSAGGEQSERLWAGPQRHQHRIVDRLGHRQTDERAPDDDHDRQPGEHREDLEGHNVGAHHVRDIATDVDERNDVVSHLTGPSDDGADIDVVVDAHGDGVSAIEWPLPIEDRRALDRGGPLTVDQ